MKRTILAAALGIAVSVAPAYGQGQIFFNNYGGSTDAIVTYCIPYVSDHVPADSSFSAGLLYGFGNSTDPNFFLTLLNGVSQPFNPATPGYFQGPIITIPGYFGGPITFQVVAYNGTGFDSPTTTMRGASALFTLPSIATGIQPVGEFGPGLKPFYAGYLTCLIPEPGTLALVGLGLVSLLGFRRKDRTANKD